MLGDSGGVLGGGDHKEDAAGGREREIGGNVWIQVFNQGTGARVAALLLRETESMGHSEIVAIRTFTEGFAPPA
jgi:hypothetical protein